MVHIKKTKKTKTPACGCQQIQVWDPVVWVKVLILETKVRLIEVVTMLYLRTKTESSLEFHSQSGFLGNISPGLILLLMIISEDTGFQKMIFFAWRAKFNHWQEYYQFSSMRGRFVYLWVLKHRVCQTDLKGGLHDFLLIFIHLSNFPLVWVGPVVASNRENLAKATGCTWLSYKALLFPLLALGNSKSC